MPPACREPFEDSRRLQGPNLFFPQCGAVLDVAWTGPDLPGLLKRWEELAHGLLKGLGWPEGPRVARVHATGASLALAGPEDRLLTATEVNEWAWLTALAEQGEDLDGPGFAFHAPGHPLPGDLPGAVALLGLLTEAERVPGLMELLGAAAARGLPTFLDDELLTLGAGTGGRTWPLEALPAEGDVPWEDLHGIPIVLVTGSNGKTTSVRLLSALCAEQGWERGHTCTDGVFLGGARVVEGDYSGPAGARRVVRDPRVQAAILETARGGFLRRGLAVSSADVVLVTNVTADHFGEYGIHDLGGLADAKLGLARALRPGGMLVLNAETPELVARAQALAVLKGWFAADHDHPLLQAHRARGGATCAPGDGELLLHAGGRTVSLGALADLPLLLGGVARYNLTNLAGAALAASALGLPAEVIARVLRRFGSSRHDNPGRLEHWSLPGLKVLMDYAHNPEGMEALLGIARTLVPGTPEGGRLGILLGQAGNRGDREIRDLATSAAKFGPGLVVLKDEESFLRGRTLGEVPALLRDQLLAEGLPPETITPRIATDREAVRLALAWARPGDILALPVHELRAREEVGNMLDQLLAEGWKPGESLP